MKRTLFFALALTLVTTGRVPRAQQSAPSPAALAPTNHPRLPRDLSQLWMAPEASRVARPAADNEFVMAVRLEVDGNFAKALPFFEQPSLRRGPLGEYAEYYAGLAQLRVGRAEEARRTFQALASKDPVGYLAEATALREADCDEALGDHAAAVAVYEKLSKSKGISVEEILIRLAHSARLAGDRDKANQALARVYYDFPLTDQAIEAGDELGGGPIATGSTRYTRGVERAEKLFRAKRYSQARSEFEALRAPAQGDDRELIDLRIAECDYFLKRSRNTRTAVRPYMDRGSRKGEAMFFYAVALRDLKENDEYLAVSKRIVAEFPTGTWADDALNELATYYILQDDDDSADAVFRTLYERFPTGHNAERAAWKIGWMAYKNANYADVVRVFERAAVDFPRSDYRPMWLYWAGRAHDGLKETALANERYTLAVTDYANSYYGRLAHRRLDERGVRPPERRLVVDVKGPVLTVPAAIDGITADAAPPAAEALPPNAPVIRALLARDLYDQAIDELHYAQKAWGDSPPIEATLAWTFWQQGRLEKGVDQFTLSRSAMNAMKRAYPHYLASGGEELPPELLKIIFPISYWDSIRKYAAEYHVDPFISAALIAQESTFVADIRSYANAWGLTQLLPSTARQYAKILKLRYSPQLLTNPDANLRMGTKYFADKIREFGQVYLALASYNAGERPVHRWVNEHPDMPEDEFIDDIPYPQTNNYVKKILGTAEDYRRLYAGEPLRLEATVVADAGPAVLPAAPASTPIPPAKASTVRKKSPRKRAAK